MKRVWRAFVVLCVSLGLMGCANVARSSQFKEVIVALENIDLKDVLAVLPLTMSYKDANNGRAHCYELF
ncbi:MAG: hypothetical protein J6M18_00520 [Actinomycetaceae bacterium]|nr:hypothetical protein [Actinomycetaceae bacterium]